MLFDLSGKRKRFIQVIYAVLALLFAVSFVGFGIGSDAGGGGIFDALGIGGNSNGGNPAYEDDIDDANKRLEENPKNRGALIDLVDSHALIAQDALDVDDQGQISVTEESLSAYADAVDAWERYLATKPAKLDDGGAVRALEAYTNLWATSQRAAEFESNQKAAVETARLAADEDETANSLAELTIWLYRSGNDEEAKVAQQRALEVADVSLAAQLKAQFQIAKQQGDAVARFVRQSKKQGAEDILNPLDGSGLGGDSPLGSP